MSIGETFWKELEQEGAITRTALERIPPDKLAWKPHEKSMTFSRLGGHIAEAIGWIKPTLENDELRMDSSVNQAFDAPSVDAMIEAVDQNLADAKEALLNADDSIWPVTWKLILDGNPMIEMPRVAVMRGMIFNHMVHHRGQLSVYLRLNNVLVPSMYGPSADEQPQPA